jgi:hypothetical protein
MEYDDSGKVDFGFVLFLFVYRMALYIVKQTLQIEEAMTNN